jgi:DNA-3-methyladenine glycosylase I
MNDPQKTNRCPWCLGYDLYIEYHDKEWGVPVHDDLTHFEFLVLESAQAGLSWLTILKRREHYRRLYDNFDVSKVAEYNEEKIQAMMHDAGIIRNRKKIESSINNAKCFLKVAKEFGSFDQYIWSFTKGKVITNQLNSLDEMPANSHLSDTITKELKKRGFRFIGTTIIYAHLQSIGIINDHLTSCFKHPNNL